VSQIEGRADIALDAGNFMAVVWEELEKADGGQTLDCWAPDGVYDVKFMRIEGRDALRDWLLKRNTAAAPTGRHVTSNLHFDFSDWEPKRELTVRGVMIHYSGPHDDLSVPHKPAGIYDFSFHMRRGGKLGWELLKTIYNPVFVELPPAVRAQMGQTS
jgi:hypothetical protein